MIRHRMSRALCFLLSAVFAAWLGRILIWHVHGHVARLGVAALFGVAWAIAWQKVWYLGPVLGASLSGVGVIRSAFAGGSIWPVILALHLMWIGAAFVAGLLTWFVVEWTSWREGRRTRG